MQLIGPFNASFLRNRNFLNTIRRHNRHLEAFKLRNLRAISSTRYHYVVANRTMYK